VAWGWLRSWLLCGRETVCTPELGWRVYVLFALDVSQRCCWFS
jgi:hypothetical protein